MMQPSPEPIALQFAAQVAALAQNNEGSSPSNVSRMKVNIDTVCIDADATIPELSEQ